MKNARLLFALILVGAAACSAAEPTGTLPESSRKSIYAGGGTGTPPDSLAQPADSTKQKG